MADINITRTDAGALINPEVSREIVQAVVENSAALRLMRRLPNLATNVREYPILDSFPIAGFVDGDTGLKPTTTVKWKKDYIRVAEIAAIIVVPDSIAADSDYDIFGQLRPRLEEAAGRVIDSAIFFGENKPSDWPTGIVTAATTAGNTVTQSADVFKDIFGVGGLISKVEEDGYFPTTIASAIGMRATLRGLTDNNKRPLFLENMQQGANYTLNGMSMDFPRNGAWKADQALMLTGDWQQAVYAMRQDVTFNIYDTGVISDENGKVLVNLMQQDSKAIRMVIRMGWNVLNPLNALNPDGSTRFPFAVYAPSGASGN